MVLYVIGTGLYDATDISLKGLDLVKKADTVYLEHYTSMLFPSTKELESFYGREILLASRDLVEQHAEDSLLLPAKNKDIVLLVVGDVFGATTHADLLLRAKQLGVTFVPIFNASIMTAVGLTGLELYKFGKTTSIVFPDHGWLPHTPYDVIKSNKENNLHTLCLLDIKMAEPSREDLLKGRSTPQEKRFMTVNQGLDVLQTIERERQENVISDSTLCVGVARIGGDNHIVVGTLQQLRDHDFGAPLHSLIIPADNLHHIEQDILDTYSL